MRITHDGLNFRSRTEASWYEFFRLMGMHPVYEPEPFEIKAWNDDDRDTICKYLPDFSIDISGHRFFVEIKAVASPEEAEDIAKACCLGYRHPTLICVGWAVECSIALVNERHKGVPSGEWCRFDFRGGRFGLHKYEHFYFNSYPDESPEGNFLQLASRDLADFSRHRHHDMTGLARQAWNATQWRGR